MAALSEAKLHLYEGHIQDITEPQCQHDLQCGLVQLTKMIHSKQVPRSEQHCNAWQVGAMGAVLGNAKMAVDKQLVLIAVLTPRVG